MMRVWFITGTSRGLGLAMAKEALRRGDRVVATARDASPLKALAEEHGSERVLPLDLDVKNESAVGRAVRAAEEWAGGIDVVVNNAGHGMHGAVEEVSDADARALFDVNVFGLLSVTRALLPGMRARRKGTIVNVSSIAGLVGSPGSGLYCASKFAVEGLSDALAEEVKPLGIDVILLEPGPFRTDFNGSSLALAGGTISDYAETAGKRSAALREGSGKQAGDPEKAARLLCDVIEAGNPPRRLLLGKAANERARVKLDAVMREIDAWQEKTLATEF